MGELSYWQRWRRDHPEYRAREAARAKVRRANRPRADRTGEYRAQAARRATVRAAEAIPAPYTGHAVFEAARAAVARWAWHPIHEELLGIATLAILEGRDPAKAAARFRDREAARARRTVSLAAFA